jgi:hypothetical protein
MKGLRIPERTNNMKQRSEKMTVPRRTVVSRLEDIRRTLGIDDARKTVAIHEQRQPADGNSHFSTSLALELPRSYDTRVIGCFVGKT